MPANPERRILAAMLRHAKSAEQDPLTPLIDEYLIKREKPQWASKRIKEYTIPILPRVRPPGRLSPSGICGCERAAALKMCGVPGKKRTDPDVELIFEDGIWRHHKWGAIFTDMAKMFPSRFRLISIEFRIEIRGLFITGHLDAHIQIKVGNEWIDYIIDFKGANEWAWSWAYKRRTPVPTHRLQLVTYIRGVRKTGVKVDRGILLYDSKNFNRYYCFPVKFNISEWDEVRVWCRSVLRQVKRKKLPPMHPECDNGNFLANRCVYKHLCYGDMTDNQIERMAYREFKGIDTLWETGLEIERLGTEGYE